MPRLAVDAGPEVEGVLADVVAWRRHLHAHPELSYQEHETSRFVREQLAAFGGLQVSAPTPTSVVAELVGSRPGPRLALRADMDALPITEENGFEFASQNRGVMHACGHDGHTAMLLGVARVLARLRARLPGQVRFIFQHAEELAPGGAQELVAQGVMEGVDAVVGAHLDSMLEVGQIGVRSGAVNASSDEFWLTITGVGGHAAHPESTVDCVAIGAQVVVNLQHLVARNVDPREALVLSVTQFNSGTAENVTPGVAELVGTVRAFNQELRQRAPELMERIIGGVTSAHGASHRLDYRRGYAPVVNDPGITELVARAVRRELGAAGVVEVQPTMGAEDFSAYLQHAPGTFFRVGGSNPGLGISHPHHHAEFTIDETALGVGVRAFVAASLELLGERHLDRANEG